ncbi:MAG TPA: transcriptional repressor [Spirochaetota bacterium]|nr:transcriptional repressor [Spirochaetota bacterium]
MKLADQVANNFREFLKGKKLFYTRQRKLVLEKILAFRPHFTAEELIQAFYRDKISVSRATVYRTILHMEDAGLIRKIDLDDNVSRYETVAGQKHHEHLICRECGKMIDFTDDNLEKITARIAGRHNMSLYNHSVEIYGLCARCRAKQERGRQDEYYDN